MNRIDAAKREVLVQAYRFDSKPIAEALIRAKKERHVDVQVLLDSRHRADINDVAALLQAADIPTRTYAPPGGIDHNKVIVVDETTVITGSFNFTEHARSKRRKPAHRPRYGRRRPVRRRLEAVRGARRREADGECGQGGGESGQSRGKGREGGEGESRGLHRGGGGLGKSGGGPGEGREGSGGRRQVGGPDGREVGGHRSETDEGRKARRADGQDDRRGRQGGLDESSHGR